jgi:hypothetical protein
MKSNDTLGLRNITRKSGAFFCSIYTGLGGYQLHIWRFISFADLDYFSAVMDVENLGVCPISREDCCLSKDHCKLSSILRIVGLLCNICQQAISIISACWSLNSLICI